MFALGVPVPGTISAVAARVNAAVTIDTTPSRTVPSTVSITASVAGIVRPSVRIPRPLSTSPICSSAPVPHRRTVTLPVSGVCRKFVERVDSSVRPYRSTVGEITPRRYRLRGKVFGAAGGAGP